MTREEQISREATKYAERNITAIRNMLPSINAMTSFVNGARWADKTMLDKACEWLERFAYNSVITDNIGEREKQAIIISFKEAMEEQQ